MTGGDGPGLGGRRALLAGLSWSDGLAKQAILDFVCDTTDPSSKANAPDTS